MTYFSNKVVWLTGASSGIGEAVAYELVTQGAMLIMSSRRKEELERVKGNMDSTMHGRVKILPLDLSKSETLTLSAEAAVQLFGRVDILINNGGISQRSLARDTKLEVDRAVMEVDYFGTVGLTKALLPHFLKRKYGHIVTVTSVIGKIGTPYRSGYAAAKHALHGFFDSLRAEVWKDNIYVTLILPGWIRTNVTLNALTGDGSKLNEMDHSTDAGLKPGDLAKKMLRAIAARKREVYIGGMKEWLAITVKRFTPGLFAKIIRKAKVR
ncbi:MAG: SDR family oxidoreductase [Flammeovirgaceae bacterium]|nr:SDR family oxidoreductase [Flammeovirgaceae bacterium]